MNLDSLFEPEAKAEFFEAIAWYENESPGLGKEFASEVLGAVDRALLQPELFRKVRGRARKVRLKRFKAYSIYFAIKDDVFSVVSVFHGARNPAELRRRLK
ncbi:MAG: type II toxin-antitoxin system RelE/ParE family toxin [Verrucomicrobiales bacterium]|nr:type II toxin-antitoxin system RelE/ParE family toxin [Verrucomicrobiales bacterium]